MLSVSRSRQAGFSLIEAVVMIMVLGIGAAAASLLIAKLAPSYNTAAHAEQAIATPKSALWQMRRDVESMLVNGTTVPPYDATCTQDIRIGSLASDKITYTYSAGKIYRKNVKAGEVTASLLLDNVTPTAPEVCPYKFMIGSDTTPSRVDVNFSYTAGSVDTVKVPVKFSLASFVAGPDATSIAPACDVVAGGVSATVAGTSLLGATTVSFGGTAVIPGVATDISIPVTVPAHASGWADLVTKTPEGVSTRKYHFRFISLSTSSGPAAGGTAITITGAGFISGGPATGVTFGGGAGTGFSVDSDTQITVTTPAHAAGAVDVVIQGITPACTLTGQYTYV